jgi:hypothetical protein
MVVPLEFLNNNVKLYVSLLFPPLFSRLILRIPLKVVAAET